MLDNEVLKTKLKNKLDKLSLNNEQKDKLVAELNFLSNLLIDAYLERQNYGAAEKQKSDNLLPRFNQGAS